MNDTGINAVLIRDCHAVKTFESLVFPYSSQDNVDYPFLDPKKESTVFRVFESLCEENFVQSDCTITEQLQTRLII